MKLIDKYISDKKSLEEKLAASESDIQKMVELQEINYRINVLDTVRFICMTAPASKDAKLLSHHFALASAYIKFLPKDRQFGNKADEELKNKRETSNGALLRVIEDGCKRFSSFKAEAEDTYKKRLNEFVSNVLIMWVQYRDTYVKVGA